MEGDGVDDVVNEVPAESRKEAGDTLSNPIPPSPAATGGLAAGAGDDSGRADDTSDARETGQKRSLISSIR